MILYLQFGWEISKGTKQNSMARDICMIERNKTNENNLANTHSHNYNDSSNTHSTDASFFPSGNFRRHPYDKPLEKMTNSENYVPENLKRNDDSDEVFLETNFDQQMSTRITTTFVIESDSAFEMFDSSY